MAITCQQAEEWFDQSLEAALAPRQARELAGHLAGCERCRRRLGREQRAVEALNALRARPGAEPAADLAERVVAALPALSPQALGHVARIVQRAAADPALRRRLQAEPRRALAELGVSLPAAMRVKAVTDWPAPLPTPDTLYLPLPETPLQLQVVEERLAAMGLGTLFGFWW